MGNLTQNDMTIVLILVAVIAVLLVIIAILDIVSKKKNKEELETLEQEEVKEQQETTIVETEEEPLPVEPAVVNPDEAAAPVNEVAPIAPEVEENPEESEDDGEEPVSVIPDAIAANTVSEETAPVEDTNSTEEPVENNSEVDAPLNINIDNTNCYTRIMPLGYDALMLPEKYIDSSLINTYPFPRIAIYTFDDVKYDPNDESAYQTLSDAYDALRAKVQEQYTNGTVNEEFDEVFVEDLVKEYVDAEVYSDEIEQVEDSEESIIEAGKDSNVLKRGDSPWITRWCYYYLLMELYIIKN